MPTLNATIEAHTAAFPRLIVGIRDLAVADQAAAQTKLNQLKNFLTANGATIDNVSATLIADTVALS